MFMAMLIPGNECNGLFHVWTEPDRRCIDCLLFVLSLFRKLGCDQRLSRDTIVSICCQRDGDGEQSGVRGASQEVLSSQSSLFSPNTDWQPATAARLSLAACKL